MGPPQLRSPSLPQRSELPQSQSPRRRRDLLQLRNPSLLHSLNLPRSPSLLKRRGLFQPRTLSQLQSLSRSLLRGSILFPHLSLLRRLSLLRSLLRSQSLLHNRSHLHRHPRQHPLRYPPWLQPLQLQPIVTQHSLASSATWQWTGLYIMVSTSTPSGIRGSPRAPVLRTFRTSSTRVATALTLVGPRITQAAKSLAPGATAQAEVLATAPRPRPARRSRVLAPGGHQAR
mmetsp:Transcript_36595/g.105439  ORF Transcript_36595/g.105439 Transcript_36595/m.105439 type:complete len:230 (-) Transcript_36595:798-1487(-)